MSAVAKMHVDGLGVEKVSKKTLSTGHTYTMPLASMLPLRSRV